jgi:hypothetical protein
VKIERDIMYMQAANCRFVLHIGSTAFVFGEGAGGYATRLELFTPTRWFRFRRRVPA